MTSVPCFAPPRDLVARLARRWGLIVGPPLTNDGVTAWVARARRGNERCVLKIAELHDEELHEADGLRIWSGDGTVRLLASWTDGAVSALLLEDCVPGKPLSDVPPERQDEVLAGLLRRLWIEAPDRFRPLAVMCASWADEFEQQPAPDLDPGLARAGIALFRSLPLEAGEVVLLGTDVHSGNVLSARREPWLVIDPKPYAGDPTYDALQHMLNFPDRLAADAAAFSDRMAGLLELDAARLRLWLFARCVQESPGERHLAAVAASLAAELR